MLPYPHDTANMPQSLHLPTAAASTSIDYWLNQFDRGTVGACPSALALCRSVGPSMIFHPGERDQQVVLVAQVALGPKVAQVALGLLSLPTRMQTRKVAVASAVVGEAVGQEVAHVVVQVLPVSAGATAVQEVAEAVVLALSLPVFDVLAPAQGEQVMERPVLLADFVQFVGPDVAVRAASELPVLT